MQEDCVFEHLPFTYINEKDRNRSYLAVFPDLACAILINYFSRLEPFGITINFGSVYMENLLHISPPIIIIA